MDNNNVQFTEEQQFSQGTDPFNQDKQSGMVKFVIKLGLAKNEKQANIVLVIVAVVILAIAAYVAF
jgi:hypothetical protein